MLMNLKAEMTRHRVTGCELASYLDLREATISSKINGKTDFTVNEAFEIRNKFFPNYSLEYLFKKEMEDGLIRKGVS